MKYLDIRFHIIRVIEFSLLLSICSDAVCQNENDALTNSETIYNASFQGDQSSPLTESGSLKIFFPQRIGLLRVEVHYAHGKYLYIEGKETSASLINATKVAIVGSNSYEALPNPVNRLISRLQDIASSSSSETDFGRAMLSCDYFRSGNRFTMTAIRHCRFDDSDYRITLEYYANVIMHMNCKKIHGQ
jgi:hypothetical protein